MKKEHKHLWHYIQQYKFHSLFLRNFGFILLVVIGPMIIVTYVGYRQLSDTMYIHMSDMNEELLEKSEAVTDNVIQDLSIQLLQVADQRSVTAALRGDHAAGHTAGAVFDSIRALVNQSPYIANVCLYSDSTGMICDVQAESFRPAQEIAHKEKWYYLHRQMTMEQPYVLVNSEESIFFCSPVFDDAGERTGLVVFDIKMQRIQELLEREGLLQNSILCLVGYDGKIIYCNRGEESMPDVGQLERMISLVSPGQTRVLGTDKVRFISVVDSAFKGWRYSLVTALQRYQEDADGILNFLATSGLISLLVAITAAYIITLITYRPVKKIVDVIEKSDLSNPVTGDRNEILYITNNILHTLTTKRQVDKELRERIEALRNAQSLALQFQINPHFLYNTLETIKWCSVEEIGIGNRTSRLLTKVAKLYRISLETDNVILTLKEEMAFLALYIDILTARYGKSIHFLWDVDEALLDCLVIKMCIQPIVENAVIHGLKPFGYAGAITIHANHTSDCLCITVENDGASLSGTRIQEINHSLQSGAALEDRVGLYNINQRIRLIYGDHYGVTLHPIAGSECRGLSVMITFPLAIKK